MDSTSKKQTPEHYQNVIVMRHGDRIDNFDPLWIATAPRPWDPPLVKEGRIRAFSTGRKFRNLFGYPLHRVFVSPFLRCIQTAAEAVIALSAVHDNPDALTGHSVTIDPSKLKVSVEYGLCEMMSTMAIKLEVAPKDGNWGFHISEREAMLPKGEGVGVALSSFRKGAVVCEVDYCGYVELRRPIFKKDQSFTAGEFEVLTNAGQTGVKYSDLKEL